MYTRAILYNHTCSFGCWHFTTDGEKGIWVRVPKAPNSEGCTTARVHYTNVTLLLLHGLAQQAIFVKQLRDAFAAFTFVPQEANEVASILGFPIKLTQT
jgi:hypothetical protein